MGKVFMKHHVSVVLGLVLLVSAVNCAAAASITLKFNNKSAAVLNSISITPKSGGGTQTILSTAVPANSTQSVTFNPTVNTCVFAVTYVFSSGKTIVIPDTDLCQTDQINVQ